MLLAQIKEITLDFHGYRLDADKDGLDHKAGIYCVYCCKYNQEADTVDLKKLLYIGEGKDINERLDGHEKAKEWEKYLKKGETLCYSYAFISGDDRFRAEAALIYHHKPPVNDQHIDHFGYPMTKMTLTGKCNSLDTSFTVCD